jgi:methylated-DNA-[protein]-cysteine S-methyltransferase
MEYHYDYLNMRYMRFLLVTQAGRLVFVGGPEEGVDVARKMLKTPATVSFIAGGVPRAVMDGMHGLLTGKLHQLPAKLYTVVGSDFQKRVYEQLRQVPYGQTRTYSELATAVGDVKAVRAVAHAVGQNPLLVVQPCHRIVPKNGGLGQFRCGVALKQSLLDIEAGKRVHL